MSLPMICAERHVHRIAAAYSWYVGFVSHAKHVSEGVHCSQTNDSSHSNHSVMANDVPEHDAIMSAPRHWLAAWRIRH